MTQTIKEFDVLDARIGVFNYRHLRRMDWLFAATILTLASIGLVILYSASQTAPSGIPYYVKQALFLLTFTVVALFIMCVDYRFLVSIAPVLYGVALLLLILVLYTPLGIKVKGGQRWLGVGAFRFQPSEITKLILVLMLAWYFSAIQDRVRKWPFLLLGFAIAAVPCLLILKQPNLGTAASLVPIAFVMTYAAGCKRWHLVAIVIAGLILARVAWPIVWEHLPPHQRDRIETFLNASNDTEAEKTEAQKKEALKKGWQSLQTKIAVGSGGMTGKGFCQGTQTQLSYLPEHRTDLIFAVLAEEQGLVGAVVVIALYAIFLLRGLALARECPDLGGALLAVGCVTILGFHIFANIAITTGLLPVTGLPLPFLSYGGSFYLTAMLCVGTILSVHARRSFFE